MSTPKFNTPPAPFIRTPYNYSMDQVSYETGLSCPDPSLTQQQFKDETDINTIVDTFMKTGHLPDQVSMPQYVDYEGVFDYQTAMNTVRAADEAFMRMDSKIRARFHNSPQEFLQFFADPGNRDEAIRLGLIIPSTQTPSPRPLEASTSASNNQASGVTAGNPIGPA